MISSFRRGFLVFVVAIGVGGAMTDLIGGDELVTESESDGDRVVAPRRRLVDLFQPGDYITYTVTANTNADRSYSLTLHTKESWTALRAEVEEATAAAAAAARDVDADRQVHEAKLRELIAQQRAATDNAERAELAREIAQLGNVVNRGRPAAAFSRSSSRQSFARVTEVGEDFIALSVERRELFLPIARVWTVTRSLEAPQENGEREDGEP